MDAEGAAGKSKAKRQWKKINPGEILDIQSYEDQRKGSEVKGKGKQMKRAKAAVTERARRMVRAKVKAKEGRTQTGKKIPQPRPLRMPSKGVTHHGRAPKEAVATARAKVGARAVFNRLKVGSRLKSQLPQQRKHGPQHHRR